jgi:hypothetical protein
MVPIMVSIPLVQATEGGDQYQIAADVQTVDQDDQEVELGEVGSHPFGQPMDRQRHEPPRCRRLLPSPGMARRSPSGSRTARRSLRVDTLISIRFAAKPAPACAPVQVGSATSSPSKLRTGPMHRHLAAMQADLALGPAPA